MANPAIVVGMLLAILGVWGYFGALAEHRSLTAFIPTAVGLVLVVLGAVAMRGRTPVDAMGAAAAVGLLGFLLAAGRFLFKLFTNGARINTAGLSTLTMAVLFATFVGLCVKSFIDARKRRRKAEAAGAVGPAAR